MFLVSDSLERRARDIRSWLPKQASVALIVAAVYFEWALCRAIIGLSRRTNREIRKDLESTYGIEKYKGLWRDETGHLPDAKTLPLLVKDWYAVTNAFNVRNSLVHGRNRYTPNMARPHVDALLAGVEDICAYGLKHGMDINNRLPQRRQKRREVPRSPSGS